jgi:hypothetical protein
MPIKRRIGKDRGRITSAALDLLVRALDAREDGEPDREVELELHRVLNLRPWHYKVLEIGDVAPA